MSCGVTPAIELVHSDGSRSRYEADHRLGSFVIVSGSERIGIAPDALETEIHRQMWRMALSRPTTEAAP